MQLLSNLTQPQDAVDDADASPARAAARPLAVAAAIASVCIAWAALMNPAAAAETSAAERSEPGVATKVEGAVTHGAHAAASGVERGARAAASGVERGAQATARVARKGVSAAASGVARGARATGNAADRVAHKVAPAASN